ncbi:hypothetical protein RRG08_054214 [Elysia crispata]|uniref:Uncharacterized protein n=1 Tax=Elysia crispata TaxID=231223 RepID=A0AAE1CVV8_9GAST|nr:hypothetical protein RRG08_054214 [Elysia crispata]
MKLYLELDSIIILSNRNQYCRAGDWLVATPPHLLPRSREDPRGLRGLPAQSVTDDGCNIYRQSKLPKVTPAISTCGILQVEGEPRHDIEQSRGSHIAPRSRVLA